MKKHLIIALATVAVMAAVSADCEEPKLRFEGNMESLRQYECPEWFQDAKFGIWAHWGPQAVPIWNQENL